jgi:hypothetical protein
VQLWLRILKATKLTRDFFDLKVLVIGTTPVLFGVYRWIVEGKAVQWKDALPLAASYFTIGLIVMIWNYLRAREEIATDQERHAIVNEALAQFDENDREVLRHLEIAGSITISQAQDFMRRRGCDWNEHNLMNQRHRTPLLIYNSQTTCYTIAPDLRPILRKALKKRFPVAP